MYRLRARRYFILLTLFFILSLLLLSLFVMLLHEHVVRSHEVQQLIGLAVLIIMLVYLAGLACIAIELALKT